VKTVLHIVAAVLAAFGVQGLLARAFGPGPLWVDVPLVAVVYAALAGGRVGGVLAGTAAGLAQDAMGGGILGVGGLAKSVAGFLAGVASTQFIVAQAVPRALLVAGATILSQLLFVSLSLLFGTRPFVLPWQEIAIQAAGNCLVGALAFATADALPGARERWRVRREYRRRARFR